MGRILKNATNYITLHHMYLCMCIIILLAIVPSLNFVMLAQSCISTKTFVFAFIQLAFGGYIYFRIIIYGKEYIKCSHIDFFLLLWYIYIIINALLHNTPIFSNRTIELFFLGLFYCSLRQLPLNKFKFVFVSLFIGGVIQSIIGNLQLWGILPTNHLYFTITGSFFNPGPYAGYLASIIPIGFTWCLFKPSFSIKNGEQNLFLKYLGRGICSSGFIILLALAGTGSRSAWLSITISFIVLFVSKYSFFTKIKRLPNIKKVSLSLIILCLFIAGIIGLIAIRPSSILGRILIWKITANIIKEHFLYGVGFDNFKAYYMNAQADYFKIGTRHGDSMVAGDTVYCFNDFLQYIVENGWIGISLSILILIAAFRVKNLFQKDIFLNLSKAGLAGIIVFALFSYPCQILPIKSAAFCYLAYIASVSSKYIYLIKWKKNIYMQLTCIFIGTCFIFISATHLVRIYKVWEDWGKASRLSSIRNYKTALKFIQNSYSYLDANGDYLTLKGKILYMSNNINEAIPVLQKD